MRTRQLLATLTGRRSTSRPATTRITSRRRRAGASRASVTRARLCSIVVLTSALIAAPVLAYQRQPDEPPLAFTSAGESLAVAVGRPVAVHDGPLLDRGDRDDVRRPAGPTRPPYVRPIVALPPNPVRVVHVGAVGGSSGHAVTGVASYYCNADPSRGRTSRCTVGHPDVGGDQFFAAIRRDLLDQLRGRRVRVCATGSRRCVEVQVIDCNCGPSANLIDLYADALERLVPVSRGTVSVVVSW